MPCYRFNGMAVHMRGSKWPAPCAAIVVMDGKRQRCAAISSIECDGPGRNGGTCDMPLCPDHAWEMGPNQHVCPMHLDQHALHQGQAGLFTSLMESY